MNNVIGVLNAEGDSWKDYEMLFYDRMTKAYSDCKVGIRVSYEGFKYKCDDIMYNKKELTRYDFLVLLLKEQNKDNYFAFQATKRVGVLADEYWSEKVGLETTLFGVNSSGVKMYCAYYYCEENKDYIAIYKEALDKLLFEEETVDLEETADVINAWLEDSYVIKGMKRFKRISCLMGSLRAAAFIVYGPEIAELLGVNTASVYSLLDRYNGVNVVNILQIKFGGNVKPCLEKKLIKKENLEILN